MEGQAPVLELGHHVPSACRVSPLAWIIGTALALAALTTPAAARDDAVSDWPCVQRKMHSLTTTQMWDGPPVDDVDAWRDDPDVMGILPRLVSRRVPIEEAATAVRRFADGVAPEARDGKLKLLFAAVLATINVDRSAVMSGIERFQQRQKARAAELERQGLALKALREKAAAADSAAKAELALERHCARTA